MLKIHVRRLFMSYILLLLSCKELFFKESLTSTQKSYDNINLIYIISKLGTNLKSYKCTITQYIFLLDFNYTIFVLSQLFIKIHFFVKILIKIVLSWLPALK